jgi:hypothetical protein
MIKKNNYDIVIKHIIEIIVKTMNHMILFDHYLIIFKILDEYTDNYANNFFNKLFLELYYRLPNTIISLFFELPNYKFLMGFLKYIMKKIYITEDTKDEVVYKLYHKILRIYAEQLKKDFFLIENYVNDNVKISDASLYITYMNLKSESENNIKDMINTHLSFKIFGSKNNLDSITKYCSMIELLLFKIKILNDKYKDYIYDNNVDTNNMPKLCLKMFNKYFYKEIFIEK